MTDVSERTLASRVDRPDVVLGSVALLVGSGVAAALVSSLPTLPVIAAGCVGAIAIIGVAMFVDPPVEAADD